MDFRDIRPLNQRMGPAFFAISRRFLPNEKATCHSDESPTHHRCTTRQVTWRSENNCSKNTAYSLRSLPRFPTLPGHYTFDSPARTWQSTHIRKVMKATTACSNASSAKCREQDSSRHCVHVLSAQRNQTNAWCDSVLLNVKSTAHATGRGSSTPTCRKTKGDMTCPLRSKEWKEGACWFFAHVPHLRKSSSARLICSSRSSFNTSISG